LSYKPGDHWMICDVCGFKYRRSKMRERWDRLWVCHSDWESRQPQDYVRAVPDRQAVEIARPEPEPVYITSDTYVTVDDL